MRDEARLLAYARATIAERLGGPAAERPEGEWFDRAGATFVTIHRGGALHGCMGTLAAWRPLADDVAHNALAAAFRDPRATALALRDLDDLEIEISILSEPEAVPVRSEEELLRALRPGIDGVILRIGRRRGTFLPQVWESLPSPRDFVAELKAKAGLPRDSWSDEIVVERYTVHRLLEGRPAGGKEGARG